MSFTDMLQALRLRTDESLRRKPPQRRLIQPPVPFTPAEGYGQYRLFDARRDLSRFSRQPYALWIEEAKRQPHLAAAGQTADRLANAYGWSDRLRSDVQRGLVIALACRPSDELVAHSELGALMARGISVQRVAAVLAETGLLLDDRADTIDLGWQHRLTDAAPAIRRDMLDWLRHLRHGSDRSRPRTVETTTEYCRLVAPAAIDWSRRHDHLREITVDHIKDQLDGLATARARSHVLIALRSLFRFLRREKRIFKDPTIRLTPGPVIVDTPLPIGDDAYRDAVAAATTPLHRVVLALAAIHAARPSHIRRIQLDDIQLGQRRITVAGSSRRLDELTYRALVSYLTYRRTRWPNTANPHLLITHRSASDTRPVSAYTVNGLFRGLRGTLDRLRRDRQLEEALTHGPDPLHLAAVFGLSHTAAMHYADAARRILESEVADASQHAKDTSTVHS